MVNWAATKQTTKEYMRLLMGKYDYRKFARLDPDEYEKKNQEPKRRAGKTLGNISVISTYALLISLFLFGALFPLTIMFGAMTILTPIMNWGLGIREELVKKGEKYLRLSCWDMKERIRKYFFPEYDWGPLQFIPDNVLFEKIQHAEWDLKETLLRTEELTEESYAKLDEDIVELRARIQKQRTEWEKLLRERLDAVEVLKKLRGDADRDNLQKVIGNLYALAKKAKADKSDEIYKSIDVLQNIYDNDERQVHWKFYSIYPEGKPEKQCILALRHDIETALDSNLKGRVTGNFRRFWARLNDVEGILAGTVDELILQGINTDEVKMDVPEYVTAIKKETPIIIGILCDADRRDAIRGLNPRPPGAELLWLIRVVKSLINLEPLMEELERKDRKILSLEDSKQAMQDDQKTGLVDWRMRHGQLYPIPDTEEEIPEYITERVPLARRQAIIVLLVGIAIGAIALWILLPFMGFRVIPTAGMVISATGNRFLHIKLSDDASTNAPDPFEEQSRQLRERIKHDAAMSMIFGTSQQEIDEARELYEKMRSVE